MVTELQPSESDLVFQRARTHWDDSGYEACLAELQSLPEELQAS